MHTLAAASALGRPVARPCAIPGCPTHHSLHLLRRAKDAACTVFRYIVRTHDRLPRSPYGLGVCGQAALQPFIYVGFRGVCPQSLY